MKSLFVLVLQFFLIYTVTKWFREQFVFNQHEIFGNDYDRKKRRSQKTLESLSQSVLEIIWLALFVSTFEPNFNFMID